MRKLMWFTLGFGGACVLGSYLWQIHWAIIPALVCLTLVLIGYRFQRGIGLRRLLAASLGFLAGVCWFVTYDGFYTQPIRALDGQTVDLEFTAYKYSWETGYGSAVDCYLDLEGKRYRVRLYLDEGEEIEPWTKIEMLAFVRITFPTSPPTARASRISSSGNPRSLYM